MFEAEPLSYEYSEHGTMAIPSCYSSTICDAFRIHLLVPFIYFVPSRVFFFDDDRRTESLEVLKRSLQSANRKVRKDYLIHGRALGDLSAV